MGQFEIPTPAMAAGVTDKLWKISDIVALIEAKEAEKPLVRGLTKSGQSDISRLAARSSGEERQSYVLEAPGRDGAGPPPISN
ncbi:hypothetical protein [Mesorhizobium sp. BH1-1-4]|uniref:hypothetical protein n=1 Tax=Mesorhizobium sp. BH1-1-4 TaxID=2876662 RepID=UPI001CD0E419|nr:hypothetical protein [Mesorhizobium sp. BH1-1-4]MBZ9992657.1 hypothetical protein [Mesorhizobium sp. BH1-1-4]